MTKVHSKTKFRAVLVARYVASTRMRRTNEKKGTNGAQGKGQTEAEKGGGATVSVPRFLSRALFSALEPARELPLVHYAKVFVHCLSFPRYCAF